jgi:hypothetical protein
MAYLSYNPAKDYGVNLGQQALERWLDQQKTATKQFGVAQQPLQQAVQSFQPGGGYGQGQIALLEDEAKRAQAEALAKQVASGMSSGSLATSTGLRVKSDLAKAKLGVEDTRTQFLNQALQALAGLRGTQAQTTASLVDPTLSSTLGYLGQRQGQIMGFNQQIQQQDASTKLAELMASLQNKAQTQTQDKETYDSLKL